ncbi:MAG TPA: SOS response-associated peptidase [Thermoanaerobaculia bacterium]|nr:SOS response-associated peptidase [Thermoanaerobaculia bacterium]
MCGRYTLTRPGDIVEETLDALPGFDGSGGLEALCARDPELSELLSRPRYNVAPSERMPVVLSHGSAGSGPAPRAAAATWGFPLPGSRRAPQINARSETAATLPAFADAFARRRCLVPADGFYEWRERQPYRFVIDAEAGFCFAGLWAETADQLAFCLLTTSANERVTGIHDRMPVILSGAALPQWLDREATRGELEALCRPFPAETMDRYPVGSRVNRAGVDECGLIAPVEPPPENLSLF